MKSMSSTIHQHLPLQSNSCRSTRKNSGIFAVAVEPHHNLMQNGAVRLAQKLSNLVHHHLETPIPNQVQYTDWSLLHKANEVIPVSSPKENVSTKWREIHGAMDYDNLLDPLHPWLRREIIKYGEFAQSTYDAFDFDSFSEYCGSCRYNRHNYFDKLGLGNTGYNVSKYFYAMSHVDVPQWLERSHLVDTWSKDSNWMGFIAVSDDQESQRIGRRDIVVSWRGTVAPSEWYEDLQRKLMPVGDGEVKVEYGFHHIYKSKGEFTRYNKTSASEQVMQELKRLVNLYRSKGEEVSLTITGHSLGGALALLNAHEAAVSIPDLPINVISFGAPRVGNVAFRDELHHLGVKTLRVVVKQDFVPRMPGVVLNESLKIFEELTGELDWIYTHVGAELRLCLNSSPYLKHGFNPAGFHHLETYLHLIDGYKSSKSTFRQNANRDIALVNKACGMLREELRIPECWYQFEHKGLVRNSHGRWVKPRRDLEDIPHNEESMPCFA
ncbi:Phospholipase a1-igamma1 protein [Thalictrum thalictroides]|uniref:Phospholipase a1-igamma1 protein n=2 Tax=Thalictrum thalictroides TaxID=46969 RepID=A0A7J6WGE0_THATH|nr:Phospholipase a1-igamma1 protein [Thalictrum thalictroides]